MKPAEDCRKEVDLRIRGGEGRRTRTRSKKGEEGEGEGKGLGLASDVDDVLAGAAHGCRILVVVLPEEPSNKVSRMP